MANGPRDAPALTKPPRSPTSSNTSEPGHTLFALVLRIRELSGTSASFPEKFPLSLRGSRIPPLPLHPAMAGLTQQPPRDTGPSPNTLPTGTTSWQVSLTQSAPPGPTIRIQAASPSNPSQLAPFCIWAGEGAWRQSRRLGELLRGYVSFSLLLSPLPRATFPSYDLCFPALPVKKGVGTSRGGGPTIQAGC